MNLFKWLLRKIQLRKQRLETSIEAYEKEFASLMQDKKEDDWPSWAKAVSSLIDKAKNANTINEGWHYFKAAYRLGLNGLSPEELEAEAESLHKEVKEKLTSWRREAAMQLLERGQLEIEAESLRKEVQEILSIWRREAMLQLLEKGQLEPESESVRKQIEETLSKWRRKIIMQILEQKTLNVGKIAQAMKIRDEHFSNTYFKNDLIKRQIITWVFYFISILIGIFSFIYWRWQGIMPLGKLPKSYGCLDILILVFLFGALGGTIFAFLSTVREAGKGRIPEQLLTWYITLMRPLWGGVGALVVYLALQAGFVKVTPAGEGAIIFSLAIAAGYTERFATRALEKIAETMKEVRTKPTSPKDTVKS